LRSAFGSCDEEEEERAEEGECYVEEPLVGGFVGPSEQRFGVDSSCPVHDEEYAERQNGRKYEMASELLDLSLNNKLRDL
jgi:hypothetical protein